LCNNWLSLSLIQRIKDWTIHTRVVVILMNNQESFWCWKLHGFL
jgi:hypothetical protein